MKTPHKHAELIKAWADGAEIECRNKNVQDTWELMTSSCWDLKFLEFRIKPKPKSASNLYYKAHNYVHGNGASAVVWTGDSGANLKLTFDGETGKLKSAEVLR